MTYKELIIKTAYETIKDNIDWGIDCKDGAFGFFIDGIIATTDKLIEKFEESYINDAKNFQKKIEERYR